MNTCSNCGNRVDQCSCPIMTERPCAICTYVGKSREMETVEDKRGFIDYWRCKDHAACADRCGRVDWNGIEAVA